MSPDHRHDLTGTPQAHSTEWWREQARPGPVMVRRRMITIIAFAVALILAITGVQAATTGPATAGIAEVPVPLEERYTLTVKLLNHTGQIPCDGCVVGVTVFNDTWESWMAQDEAQDMAGPTQFAGDGEHSFEVLDGVHTMIAKLQAPKGVGTTDPSASRVDWLVAMEVPVHGDTEVTLDAREAELLTRPQVGQEVQVRSQTAAWCHNQANGGGMECLTSLDNSGNQYTDFGARELYVTPFGDWTLQPTWLWEQWHMGEPQPLSPLPAYKDYGYEDFNYSPTPAYMYRTALLHDHGASAQDLTDRSFSTADFVEVPRSYHADKPETVIGTTQMARPVYPGGPAPYPSNSGGGFGGYPTNKVYFEPGEVTEYYLADDRVVWTQSDWLHYGPEPGPAHSGFDMLGQEVYLESEAGTRREVEDHFQAPHQHGAPETNHRYWEHTRTGNFYIDRYAQIVPGMVRIGDQFYPPYSHNWDSIPGRPGIVESQPFKTSWRMWNTDTGQELSHPQECESTLPLPLPLPLPQECQEAYWLFSMDSAPATYRLEQTDAYPGWMEPYFQTKPSGTSTTVWTFSSARSDAKLPPDEYRCFLARGSGNECQIQPLIQLHYDLGLDTYNRAPAGARHTFTIEAGPHSEAVGAAPVTEMSVQASFDDGATWQALRTSACRGGSGDRLKCYQVTAKHPRLVATNGFVALRVQATDANGGTVDQTIIRAYILK